MKLHLSRGFLLRWGWVCLLGLLGAACQRTPIQLNPGQAGATATVVAERTATLQEVVGTVEMKSALNSAWTAATVGDHLTQGSQVRTSAGSRALVQLTEGSRIRIEPNTTFAVKILNPYLDSLLTSLDLQQGKVWVLLNGGALDVETPLGIASARAAYLSADFDAQQKSLLITCLQGTCSFGDRFIPSGSKFAAPKDVATGAEAMTMTDYGAWGSQVPEATQLAWLSTEAVVQGSATLPVVATATPTRTPRPKATATPRVEPTIAATVSPTPAPADTSTPQAAFTATSQPTAQPKPSMTPSAVVPTATAGKASPAPTARPFTPIPAAPVMGRHVVLNGETLFCIARGYGVLPAAIAQANGLFPPFNVVAGQTLAIPEVQWVDIAPGPVCPTQFTSLYPGVVVPTPTPAGTQALTLSLAVTCLANCDVTTADYLLHIAPTVAGGVAPYAFTPGPGLDADLNSQPFGHCTDVQGQVTVTAADGQTATAAWFYHDGACPTATVAP
jgi:LysM repeat protein